MTLDDRLEHYQDENIKNVNKLMASKTPDWAGTYEEEKKNLKQAILSDLLQIIGEDESVSLEQEAIDHEFDLDARGKEANNKYRQELRKKVKKYCE